MAVAMETTAAWRGGEVLDVKKKKRAAAWGADAQQLMHMMVGQLQQSSAATSDHVLHATAASSRPELSTLDLLGKSDPCSSNSAQIELHCSSPSPLRPSNFLELGEPEAPPLPSGWEKCLDLKTGKVYYVSQASGVSTFNDPRRCSVEIVDVEPAVTSPRAAAHEFLGSKRSETLRQENCTTVRGASSSSSSGRTSPTARGISSGRKAPKGHHSFQLLSSFSTGKKLWNLQLDDQAEEEESVLELDLNLAAGGSSSPSRPSNHQQAVCTMEMIQNALKRTAGNAFLAKVHREHPLPSAQVLHQRLQQYKPASGSSSFSSLTSTRSDPIDSNLAASPSTSSSSSTSSRSLKAAPLAAETRQSVRACEVDSSSDALVMGACTRCLMYVMLKKLDPRCPRCESEVPVDFSTGHPAFKRQRVVL